MKILYLSPYPPFDPARVASGGQVREAGIHEALEAAGHAVIWRRLAPGEAGEGVLDDSASVARCASSEGADAILVSYWSLLQHLPDTGLPVVLDFIAPRLLEAMFQEPGRLQHEGRELLALLPRADHFLVGNSRQADFLLPLLLLAGIDCRARAPISLLPISISGEPASYDKPLDRLQVINAGVDWPWRDSRPYMRALEELAAVRPQLHLKQLTGSFPGAAATEHANPGVSTVAGAPAGAGAGAQPGAGAGAGAEGGLLPYGEMRRCLHASHLGLELGERNTEREFCHSFRLAEYLQAGLPVLINPWIQASELVQRYDAGWVIEDPGELTGLVDELLARPELLLDKARGARALALEHLHYQHSCLPLLDWLAQPWRPERLPATALPAAAETAARPQAARGWRGRLQHTALEVARLLLTRRRPALCQDVLMVSRADLFPPDHGAAVKILRTAEALSRQGRDVWLCTDDRRRYFRFHEGAMQELRYPLWLRWLALPRPVGLLRLLLRGFPLSNAFLYFPLTDASYALRTLWLTRRYPVGAFQAEFPAYVKPCRLARKIFGGRLLLVEHNVEYARLREQLPGLRDDAYQQLKDLELMFCNVSDAVVAVSENDRARLAADGVDPRKLTVIPHGVDLERFRSAVRADARAHYGIPADHVLLVYHGTYSYEPNLQAMQVMARELLPRLRALGLRVSVLAIGSRPPASPLDRDIHFVGSVERLEELLPAADLALVPLLEGGGTRMKILDYFAAGVPVISTAKGIEGIAVRHGREALIVDDFDAMCAAVKEVLEDRDLREGLSSQARAFVEDLSWEAIARRYLPLLFP